MSYTRSFLLFILAFLSTILLANSCMPDLPSKIQKKDKNSRTQHLGELVLPLDKQTIFFSNNIQLIENKEGKDSLLVLLYSKERKIVVYNLNKKIVSQTIFYKEEGPNGVGSEISTFYWKGDDEIYLLSYWDNIIYTINTEGIVRNKLNLSENISDNFDLSGNGFSPIIKSDDFLYSAATMNYGPILKEKEKIKPLCRFNLKTNATDLLGKYPDIYFKSKWLDKDAASISYNQNNKTIITSIPMDDSIRIVDLNGNILKTGNAKSKYPELKKIRPYSENWGDQNNLEQKEEWEYQLSPCYLGIKYDSYRNIYYRFTYLGAEIDDFMKGNIGSFGLIVLDENLNIITEEKLPDSVNPSVSFIGKEGLHIGNKYKYDTVDDDFLIFEIYSFKI